MTKITTFGQAVKILDIEKYADRIIQSNSKGELFHLIDYIEIANGVKNPEFFKSWFEQVVKAAEENWERPESVFQHILKLLEE